jgi:hypothetical protein
VYEKLTTFDCPGSNRYVGNGANNNYPRPFLDYASVSVPQTFSELLDWSEFAFLASGDYHALFQRLYNYFNTDVRIRSVDSKQKPLDDSTADDWRRLIEKIGWGEIVSSMLFNLGVYGNEFISVYAPIRRFLICPNCGQQVEFRTLATRSGSNFAYRKGKFVASCFSKYCKANYGSQTVPWKIYDLRAARPESFKIKQWPVREMVIHHYAWSDRTMIYWRIPEHYKRAVQFGDIETLAEADEQVLEAIERNILFKFREDRIMHLKEPTLTGLQTRGWGLPRSLFLHRQGWTVQLLRKNTQAIALDWVTPIKLVSPMTAPVGGAISQSPAQSIALPDFARMFGNIVRQHNDNPTGWHATTVPVQPSILGGNADQLFPHALIQHAKDEFIDAGGFPVELYRGSMTLQTAPVGLRLFEATNKAIPALLNRALAFVTNRISELASREPVDARHERVTYVDDIELLMAKLQMGMSGGMAMSDTLNRMGVDFREDAQQRMREQRILQDLQAEEQERIINRERGMAAVQPQPGEQQAMGGDPAMDPTMGMLPSQGYTPPQLPDQMEEAAVALAQTLSMMPPQARQQELRILRERYKTFHSIVVVRLREADNANAQQGRQMMMEGGPPM